ncbi:hypothetical protein MN608_07347 [Microdochium nivale]|nr:hypothetical protein MN608_07347 [Microdochium nivale]
MPANRQRLPRPEKARAIAAAGGPAAETTSGQGRKLSRTSQPRNKCSTPVVMMRCGLLWTVEQGSPHSLLRSPVPGQKTPDLDRAMGRNTMEIFARKDKGSIMGQEQVSNPGTALRKLSDHDSGHPKVTFRC